MKPVGDPSQPADRVVELFQRAGIVLLFDRGLAILQLVADDAPDFIGDGRAPRRAVPQIRIHGGPRHQLHPVVLPQVSHLRHVPLRTSVKLPHSAQASPS